MGWPPSHRALACEILTNLFKLRSPCLLISRMEIGGGGGSARRKETVEGRVRTPLSLLTFLKIWSEIPRELGFIEGGPDDLSWNSNPTECQVSKRPLSHLRRVH